jgi:hypothetical protein
MIYRVQANDGASSASRVVHVEAISGFAEVETSGVLNPIADVMAMQFSFPAARFDLTIGATEIPFSIRIGATTERVENLQPPPHRLASFGLATAGEQTSAIDVVQRFERAGFSITLAPAGSTTALAQAGGADCDSTGGPGCIVGTFTGTVDAFALTQLKFLGGNATIRDPSFTLGTDSLGISWTADVTTRYPLEGISQTPPLVFTPEPGSAALLGIGLLVLGARRRC